MKLSDDEKRTAIAACTYAIAANDKDAIARARFHWLRKKLETALRNSPDRAEGEAG